MTQTTTALDLYFDADLILSCIGDLLDSPEIGRHTRIQINHPKSNPVIFVHEPVAYNIETKTFVDTNREELVVHERFRGTYLEEVVNKIIDLGKTYGAQVTKARILKLDPTYGYTYHKDNDEFRFHIPLKTNPYAFLMSEGVIERMPEVGRVYLFATNRMHTAINLSATQARYHLVFDTR